MKLARPKPIPTPFGPYIVPLIGTVGEDGKVTLFNPKPGK